MTPDMRFLLLSPNPPYPTNSGTNQRTFLLFKSLERMGPVDFMFVGDEETITDALPELRSKFNYVGCIPRDLGDFAPRQWTFDTSPIGKAAQRLVKILLGWRNTLYRSQAMCRQLAEQMATGRYSAIVTRYLTTAAQTGAFEFPSLYIDLDDLESEIWHSRASEEKSGVVAWSYRQISASYRRRERALVSSCAGAWVAKAKDVQTLGQSNVEVLPNIPFAAYPEGVSALPPAARPVVMGVGLFDWLPNKMGFDWFVTHVWPQVHSKRPEAELHLVGKLTDPEIIARWKTTPGVHYLGRVDDLQAAYATALFTVAPIFTGGGTNIKVVESLAFGRCCAVTPHAVKGFDNLPGLHVGRNEEALANICLTLLEDMQKTSQEGLNASAKVGARFSFEQFYSAVQSGVLSEA